MKTPRDLLFERHRHATPRLDAIRREALARLPQSAAHPTRERPLPLSFDAWVRRWLFSLRWHLAGLTAAWLFITWLNLENRPAANLQTARASTSATASELLAALKENRRQMAEWLAPSSAASPSPSSSSDPAPPAFVPKRRSEGSSSCANA